MIREQKVKAPRWMTGKPAWQNEVARFDDPAAAEAHRDALNEALAFDGGPK